MLSDQDQTWLVRQLVATAELLGHAITPAAAAMLANDLSAYPREALARSLYRVRTEHGGKLTPKAIMDRLDEALGRLAPNEAWSLALKALDERETVVWPKEAEAAWGIAYPVAASRDLVGARMAFLAAYERLVRTSREAREPPQMTVSVGWCPESRTKAIQEAEGRGYLLGANGDDCRRQALGLSASAEDEESKGMLALGYSGHSSKPPAIDCASILKGQLSEAVSSAPEEVRQRLKALVREIRATKRSRFNRAEVAARVELMRLGRLKREADAAARKATGGAA